MAPEVIKVIFATASHLQYYSRYILAADSDHNSDNTARIPDELLEPNPMNFSR